MSANVDVPYTRRNVSQLSQRSGNAPRTPRPINESMVRERLSANLPDSFRYLNNTLPMGATRPRHHHHQHRRGRPAGSTSSGASSRSSRSGSGSSGSGHARTRTATRVPSSIHRPNEARSRSTPAVESSSSSSRTNSSRASSRSSSTDSRRAEADVDAGYNFYARLVKLDRSAHHATNNNSCGGGGAAPLVAQCCDTVRGTLDLLDQVHLSTCEGESRDKFFWLDLHGVPPPLPGSAEWKQRPKRWRRKQRAALREAAQSAGGSRDVPLRELWTALNLQEITVNALTEICQQRQLHPRPDRSSLDDVYEEELLNLNYPDDRIVHVEPLPVWTDASIAASSEPIAPDFGREWSPSHASQQRQPSSHAWSAASGSSLRVGSTHYVVLEVATLLTSVPATATSVSAGAWSSTFLAHVGSYEYANEPLEDLVWTENVGRRMRPLPAAQRVRRRGGPDSRALTHLQDASMYAHEAAVTPLITSTYVLCFPNGCVTWCPGSTLGLTSAERRERRHNATAQQRARREAAGHDDGGSSSDESHEEDGLEVQYVKSWEQLQTSVFHRLRHMASRQASSFVACNTPSLAAAGPALSTSCFLSLFFSAVCYAYLPSTTSVLSEVDAIDSMLPLVGLNVESDQADALRRVLLLRRKLAVHRRLLFQKARLLEALDRPAMHTLARFVRTVKAPSWAVRAAAARAEAAAAASARSTKNSTGSATHTNDGRRRGSDIDSLTDLPSPPHLQQQHRDGSLMPTSLAGPIVHFVDTPTAEAPWSTSGAADAEELLSNGGAGCGGFSPAADRGSGSGGRGGRSLAARSRTNLPELPSLNVIHTGISNVLRSLEVARTVLGNTTLIYCSTVNYSNSRSSETADYFALICQYVLLTVLPLNIVASHWGMNCFVPFMAVDNTKPFFGILAIMIFLGVAGFVGPFYAYRTRKIYLIA